MSGRNKDEPKALKDVLEENKKRAEDQWNEEHKFSECFTYCKIHIIVLTQLDKYLVLYFPFAINLHDIKLVGPFW